MRLSPQGLDFIRQTEEFSSRTYMGLAGVATIGFGHRLIHASSFPDGIDASLAMDILASDIRDAEHAVEHLVRVPLSQGQYDALVDFAFNVGAGRLASSTLLKVLNRGRHADAAEQMLRWDVVCGEENADLKARRQGELQLWNTLQLQHQQAA